jgi:hypothetical protein
MGRYLAQHLPQCHAAFYPNEGHLSLVEHHAQEILGVLAAEMGSRLDPAGSPH